MSDENMISSILSIVLIFMIVILGILCIWYLILKTKANREQKKSEEKLKLSSKEIKSNKEKR